jgi:hypothetical protein
MLEGRWCSTPPRGYVWVLGSDGKRVLQPGEKAKLIVEAFELAADTDLPLEEIRRRLYRNGLKVSRSYFPRLLRSVAYCGKVWVPAYDGEPERVVEGVHEAIVSEATFWRVQKKRFGYKDNTTNRNSVQRRGGPKAELILKGHLLCPSCGHIMTGSVSKGNGGRYWYYHCHRCKTFRTRADEANAAFPVYLRSIQIAPEVADLYALVVQDLAKESQQEKERRMQKVEQEIEHIEEKLFNVDEKYVEGGLPLDSYRRLKSRYDEEADELRRSLTSVEAITDDAAHTVASAARALTDLP